jgi:hypothetical protein
VVIIRNKDVFPAPSGPINPKSSPFRTSNEIVSSASFSPYRFVTLLAIIDEFVDISGGGSYNGRMVRKVARGEGRKGEGRKGEGRKGEGRKET